VRGIKTIDFAGTKEKVYGKWRQRNSKPENRDKKAKVTTHQRKEQESRKRGIKT
jgi:hypothetical protein